MPVPPDQISLIVVTYQQPRRLDRVLESLAAGSALPGEILVADDGSGPETADVVERWSTALPCPVRHLWQEDEGFRKSRIQNRAIDAASLPYIVLLDGDCIPHRAFVRDHADLAESGTFVQPRRAHLREEFVEAYLRRPEPYWRLVLAGRVVKIRNGLRYPVALVKRDEEVAFTLGCNFAAWRKDLLAVNGYDEAFEGYGSEDWDLALRLIHLGRIRKHVRGRASVLHLDHPLNPRHRMEHNQALLEETRLEGRVRCQRGIQDLTEGSRLDA